MRVGARWFARKRGGKNRGASGTTYGYHAPSNRESIDLAESKAVEKCGTDGCEAQFWVDNACGAVAVRSVAVTRLKTANRFQALAPIWHGLVGNGSCLAQVGSPLGLPATRGQAPQPPVFGRQLQT